jgi:hypothetical protein
VHDLKVHPREHELIAGTHGRSIYVVDVAPLEELADSVLKKPLHVFAVRTAYQYNQVTPGTQGGDLQFHAQTPPYGAVITYHVAGSAPATATEAESNGDGGSPRGADTTKSDTSKSAERARVVITNIKGDTVRALTGPGGPGFHHVVWDLRGPADTLGPAARRDSLANAQREEQRLDSLKAATGRDVRAELERAKRPEWAMTNPRPAEAPLGATEEFRRFLGRGERRGKHVNEGEYLARVTVGERIETRVIKVVRVGEVGNESFFP